MAEPAQHQLGSARGRALKRFSFWFADPELSRNPQSLGFLGYAYARAGRYKEAEAMAAGSHYANQQALIYAGLGEKTEH